MSTKIPMSAPDLDASDEEAVLQVLRSGRLSMGPWTEIFERDLARFVGVRHGVAVNSGTSALHLIVKALGIGPGDEVLVPSFTFAASVNAILYEGATPVFVDIEPDTGNIDPVDAERRITPSTKAIMPVDVFGHPCEWDDLLALDARNDLKVIDDSCEALGARYKGRELGGFGNASAFAFYPNKQMTTGEGGIICTDDDELAAACRGMRNQGRSATGAWLEHERLGFNYRIDEMSAALGVSQLRRLPTFLQKRKLVADRYARSLARLPEIELPSVRRDVDMSWFVYVVKLPEGCDRDAVIRGMERRGIPARGYFSPMHGQAYLRQYAPAGGLPVTDALAKRTIALPFHNQLTSEEIEIVVETLEASVKEFYKAGEVG